MTAFTVEPVSVVTHFDVKHGERVVTSRESETEAQDLAAFLNSLIAPPAPEPKPVPEPDPEPVPEPEPIPEPGPVIAPGTRSIYREIGARDAPHNLGIGSGVELTEQQHFNPETDFPNGYNIERDIYLLDPTAPLVDVFPHKGDGMKADYSRADRISNVSLGKIRVPRNFRYDEISLLGQIKGNGCGIALTADPRVVVYPYQLYVGDGYATAKKFVTWPDEQYEANGKFIDGPMLFGSHGGCLMNASAIRYGEMLFGPATHAIGMIMPGNMRYRPPGITDDALPVKNGKELWEWRPDMHRIGPALQGDNLDVYSGKDPWVRPGSLYTFAEDISSGMRTLAGKYLALTIYQRGVYDIDSMKTGQPGFSWCHEPNMGQPQELFAGTGFKDVGKPEGAEIRARDAFEFVHGFRPRVIRWNEGFGSPRQQGDLPLEAFKFLLDMDDMFRAMRVVKNNRPGQWGGGGIPRGPLKAEILERF